MFIQIDFNYFLSTKSRQYFLQGITAFVSVKNYKHARRLHCFPKYKLHCRRALLINTYAINIDYDKSAAAHQHRVRQMQRENSLLSVLSAQHKAPRYLS